MKQLWGALLVLALSAFMPDHLSAQGVSTQTGKARGAGLELGQNFPNPFDEGTDIPFTISRAENVNLALYDMQGRMVRVLINGSRDAGHHTVHLDAGTLAKGIYFYKLQSGEFTAVKKLIIW